MLREMPSNEIIQMKQVYGISIKLLLIVVLGLVFSSCSKKENPNDIVIWHQMRVEERQVFEQQLKEFEASHPGVKVTLLFKETEELRSGYIIAAMGGEGPDLVYSPSDNVGIFAEMNIIRPLNDVFPESFFQQFTEQGIVRYKEVPLMIADKLGNHLTLVYNKKFVKTPPTTEKELVELGKKLTVDENNDGKTDRYGLVWNYTEPYFFIPFYTGFGGWVFDQHNNPTLANRAMVDALSFLQQLRNEYKIIPPETDYDVAETLFKEGKAAMIINGDWSWAGYGNAGVDYGITPLPEITTTGKRAAPMVAAKGYTVNVNVSDEKLKLIKSFLEFALSPEKQLQTSVTVKTIPTHLSIVNDSLILNDPVLSNSKQQIEYGRPIPIITEMRVIWDAMRPVYQKVLKSNQVLSRDKIEEASREMQASAQTKINQLREQQQPGVWGAVVQVLLLGMVAFMIFRIRKTIYLFFKNLSKDGFAYILALPAFAIMLAVILYPFVYNVILSFSNMNLSYIDNWSIIGLQQYLKVFSEPRFYEILGKTLIWTVANIFFHVTIGVALALMLNRDLPGKSVFRTLLILPWAIPQYIVALTWRGMFNYEYGSINAVLGSLFGMQNINWLGSPVETFIAVITTNVWLGFPFMMIIALGALQSIPTELYEAADLDGAKWYHKLRHITIPLIKPVMVPAITLGTIWTFNQLNVVWLVSNAGEPSDSTHILVSYVYKAAFNMYDFAYAAAFSMVIFLILFVFNIVFTKRTQAAESMY